ncbi:ribonuclease D [Carnimonas nigrificans]|uniref:ribonuclease D n=1 Tax=Carnimonas nigrificans TaxID=64323 RepID=UPI000472E290|nr:ribonuclease D [Carnimonas nigrificans]
MQALPITWVDNDATLGECCDALAQCKVLAVDTEFRRETTFHAIPALVQLSDGEYVWLIDPLALDASAALQRLFGHEGPLKLIHACSEDLEVLQQWVGVLPEPLIDTQHAQALCSDNASMGYQRLVAERLDIELEKDATRSDWLARPLSERQRRYAALDVLYLPRIWEQQRQQLEALGRLEWLQSDCQQLIDAAREQDDYADYFRRNRNAWKLSPVALAAYQRLCQWREQQARARDIPRNWLAADRVLLAIAEKMPRHKAELAAVDELRPAVIKRDGATLLALVEAARHDTETLPGLLSPVTPRYRNLLKQLKSAVQARADALGVSAGVLASRRDIERFIQADSDGTVAQTTLGGWRAELLDAELRQVIEQEGLS